MSTTYIQIHQRPMQNRMPIAGKTPQNKIPQPQQQFNPEYQF